jgi:hypothetical protein
VNIRIVALRLGRRIRHLYLHLRRDGVHVPGNQLARWGVGNDRIDQSVERSVAVRLLSVIALAEVYRLSHRSQQIERSRVEPAGEVAPQLLRAGDMREPDVFELE